jgi:hypothetical protein
MSLSGEQRRALELLAGGPRGYMTLLIAIGAASVLAVAWYVWRRD